MTDKAMYEKMLCLLNPEYFIKDVLGYSVERHHSEILRYIQDNRSTLVLSPRGFGKSSIVSISFVLWRLVQDRNIRVLIVSSTATQGASFLREIRHHLENNQKLISIFGSFVPDKSKWTEYEITLSNRTTASKESTISTAGANGSVTGRHFDLVVADDLTDFESSRTQVQREKLSSWYRTSLLPSLEPHGQLIAIGTRYHPLDLYEELINSGKYAVLTQRAINEDGLSLWPTKFSIEDLQKTKEELGSLIFDLQFQNSTLLMRSSNIFHYEWFKFYSHEELPQEGMRLYMGVDLAISKSDTADWFSTCVVAHHKQTGLIYVVDVYRARLSFNEQINVIKNKANQYSPVSISIEANAFQAALSGELQRITTLPIHKVITTKDKTTRAMKRSVLFENGKILIKKDMHVLIEELTLLPNGQNDDEFDSMDMALTGLDKATYTQASTPAFMPSFVLASPRAERDSWDSNRPYNGPSGGGW